MRSRRNRAESAESGGIDGIGRNRAELGGIGRMGGRMNEWMYLCMDGWLDVWMNGWLNKWMNGWVDGWMHELLYGWMDGWMDGRNTCGGVQGAVIPPFLGRCFWLVSCKCSVYFCIDFCHLLILGKCLLSFMPV